MKKKLIVVILLLALLVGGYFYFKNTQVSHADRALVLYGNVDTRQVTLGFRVGGRIERILVDEGDIVHAGDVIAELDTEPYRLQLDMCSANLAAAEANLKKLENGYRSEEIKRMQAAKKAALAQLKNAEIQHERNVALLDEAVIAQKDVDASLASRDTLLATLELVDAELELKENGYREEDIASARAQVESAKASVEAQELNLKDCQLIAPEDGIVQIRSKEPGAMVAAGTGIVTETLNSPVWIRAYVPETLLGEIQSGMKVDIYMDSAPEQPAAQGQIGFISPVAEFTPKSVETATLRTDLVYRIRIVVESGAERLLQGMPVTIRTQLSAR
ncbi:MAG: efflux RND transporter periplasmic adaptor subunit [Verrucomicrobia bacterium]|nr:efflux RND transporter periplasmic adaptor subunit [Verrucomicrobiota bacterium]MBQ7590194.1 efflux RND transporter periplasmic adaptor subunit [Verrucomicrobiota bacterium]